LFQQAGDVEALAAASDLEQPVIFVPGFVGLGAPHWVPDARGVLFGLTRGTTAADLGRATLEGVAFQVADLIEAAGQDVGESLHSLRADGGMTRNAWFVQRQADLLGIPVRLSSRPEATAWGAAALAGLKAGVWPSLDIVRSLDGQFQELKPQLTPEERAVRFAQWRRAVQAVITYYAHQ
jgi:glycerol kinase